MKRKGRNKMVVAKPVEQSTWKERKEIPRKKKKNGKAFFEQ